MVSSVAGNAIAVTRFANNMVFANMEAFKNSMLQAKDNAKELSRVGVNAIRCSGQISRDTTATASRFYGVSEHFGLEEAQITSRRNEEETQRVIEAQDHNSGERKEQTVRDFPVTAAVGQALKL
jgi:hypothetical protein